MHCHSDSTYFIRSYLSVFLENIVVTPALEPTVVLPTDTSSALCKKTKLLLVIIIYSMLFFYYLITFVF